MTQWDIWLKINQLMWPNIVNFQIKKNKDFAFIEFSVREHAQRAMTLLKGIVTNIA